ncbi:hypothetical protein LSAT2_017002, partial [Lamellibrachia satsuma]
MYRNEGTQTRQGFSGKHYVPLSNSLLSVPWKLCMRCQRYRIRAQTGSPPGGEGERERRSRPGIPRRLECVRSVTVECTPRRRQRDVPTGCAYKMATRGGYHGRVVVGNIRSGV